MNKRRLGSLLLAMLLLSSAWPAFAQPSADEAWRLAVGYVPASALPVGVEQQDDGAYLFHFEDALRNIRYDVRVLPDLMAMQEVQMTALNLRGAPQASVSPAELEAAISATYPGAVLHLLRLEQGAGLYHYLATFTQVAEGLFYAMQFNAQTCDLMNYVMKQAAPVDSEFLSLEQVLAIGSTHTPDGVLTDLSFTMLDGRYVYLLTFWQDGGSITLTIEALSGEILSAQDTPIEAIATEAPIRTPASTQPQPAPTMRPTSPPRRATPAPRHTDDDDDDDD